MSEALELVALFADADAERFIWKLVERGVERKCIRAMPREARRDPMCDASLCRDPLTIARPYLVHPEVRFLVVWDHQGSGREREKPAEVEDSVRGVFQRAGVSPDRVEPVALEPELECVLEPAWDRVSEVLATKRKPASLPSVPFNPADPKASFEALTKAHQLRLSPALFSELGGVLSLGKLKQGRALDRIAARLVSWFPPA